MAANNDTGIPSENRGLPSSVRVRPLPKKLPYYVRRARMCDGTKCRGPDDCTFAHNALELNRWNIQLQLGSISLQSQQYHGIGDSGIAGSFGEAHIPRQSAEKDYAASKLTFQERIKDPLDPGVIEAPLTRENYRKRFHNMICWEEKRHVEVLDTKCSGVYSLVIYQSGLKPHWIYNRNRGAQCLFRYGHLEGIDADRVAYVTQSSEAAFIIGEDGSEVKMDIMRENFNHSDEHLYVGFTRGEIPNLTKLFPGLPNSKVTYSRIKVEFEVKHSYFNSLIRSVSGINNDVINRLLPKCDNFLPRSSANFQYTDHMRPLISQLDPDDQLNALKTIAMYPSKSPPILINGSFGTGKSRVLAIATYFIIENARGSEPVRILVCAHHRASADNFVDAYFSDMIEKHLWKIKHFFRFTVRDENPSNEKLKKYFLSFDQLKRLCGTRMYDGNMVIASTLLSALRLRQLFPPGFFTHILLDEGAQCREAEAIAPLSLASKNTQIVIAGDSNQVGPALLVLGEEARDSGFKLSLLERLQMEYKKIGGRANEYSITLSTNHRCHKEILAIPHQLFYKGLKSKAYKAIPHPQAPYPLLFVCSNLTSDVHSSVSDQEAQLLLEQVNNFVGHRSWPHEQWGKYDISNIAVVTATRTQLVVTRKLCRTHFKKFERIRLLPCYDIQGQEFQALFLSTTEPVDAQGNTTNPTKSSCDRYVFNTVLTRAKSLVVVVGSPLVLLKTEAHMAKLYGSKGKCWSVYLKTCLEHKTFIIPSTVGDSEHQRQQFKVKLATRLGIVDSALVSHPSTGRSAAVPSPVRHLECNTKSRSPAKPKVESPSFVAQQKQKSSGMQSQPSKALQPSIGHAGNNHSVKSNSSAASNSEILSVSKSSNTPMTSKADKPSASMKPSSFGQSHGVTDSQVNKTQSNAKSKASAAASPKEKASPKTKSKFVPIQSQKIPSNKGKDRTTFKPPVPKFNLSEDFPSLEEAKEVPKKFRAPFQQPKLIPEAHTEVCAGYKDKIDVELLKEELTRENYVEKFHHLLLCEEQEHHRILNEKCNGMYTISFCSPQYPPYVFDDKDSDYCQYGLISGEDGDILAYAKQASEGSLITLNESFQIRTEHVRATVPRGFNPNSIVFGLNKGEVQKLTRWKSTSKQLYTHPYPLQVKFEVKHSYFGGLHTALTKLTDAGIQKMVPQNCDFTNESVKPFMPGPPQYPELDLDFYQKRALFTILNCSSGAPILVTGPFGTGKTRLLVRAAYEILRIPGNRVLMCAHHQNSVDTFIDYIGKISWCKKVVRVVLNNDYIVKNKPKYPQFFKARNALRNINQYDLVVTTLGTSRRLKNQCEFTHILIDEGAQTREPETISPLCFATKHTKVVIAGDHLQVGPRVLVLGKEAQEYGLATSLLERLHAYYNSKSATRKHTVSLLTNYRCHSGILMLPSSLFYGSTLQCRSEQMCHPSAPFPLQFVCSSINRISNSNLQGRDESEAQILLEQVTKYVSKWPDHLWGQKSLESICIMTPSADQFAVIKRIFRNSDFNGVTVLKSDDIQGREFRAVFIGTSDVTSDDGSPLNPTKTVFDPSIFNTAITRSKSLVVAVGNPFLILQVEKQMEKIHGDRAKCWSQFMKQCLECNTFHFSNEAKNSVINKDVDNDYKTYLHDELFHDFKTRIEVDSSETQGDSILKAYQVELEKIYEYKKAKLTLARASKTDLSWIMNDQESQATEPPEPVEKGHDKEEEDYVEKYDCILNFHSYREAEAVPIDPKKRVITIRGSGNRIGAFDGDTFEVGIFHGNPDGKCYGRALKLRERGGEATFICRVSHHNPVMFYPIDKKNSKFINLPRISRDLLQKRDKDAVKDELKSTDVVVFDHHAIDSDSEELKIPPICRVIPHSVAKDMLFIVAYLRWKEPYRFPLGIVIGVLPKGHTLFSAERLLKVKHSIEFNEDVMKTTADAILECDSGPLFDRAFTIDPDGAQNLDDAISLIKLPSQDGSLNGESVETYQLGVHIVNCARYIESNGDIDREARRRGISVYSHKEGGKIMQMLPAQIRERLSLLPNKIRDVLSVIANVSIDSDGMSMADIEIKEAKIKSCVQLTYMSSQDIMNGKWPICNDDLTTAIHQFDCRKDQPSLSMTLQLLYKIALTLKKERLQSDAAYYCDINDPEDLKCWQTHMLIEELMIWANSKVAEKVHRKYPDTALLRRQPEPNLETMKAFTEKHKEIASMSLNLSSLVSNQQDSSEDPLFLLTSEILSEIREAKKSIVYLISLLFSDRYYPQLASVHSQLRLCLPRAEYCCTDTKIENSHHRHYSLKLDRYTHFSSPLRRYIDIEVQRMLIQLPEVASMPVPTTQKVEFLQSEHQSLCSHLNRKYRSAHQFEQSIKSVYLALKHSSSSEIYNAFIADNSKGSIEFCFPRLELQDIPLRERKVSLKFLGPYANVKEEDLVSVFTSDSQEFPKFHWKIQMTSFSAEQGAFILNIPNLQICSSNGKAEKDAISVEIFTANIADPDDFTLSVVRCNAATSKPLTFAIPFDKWKKVIDFVKNPSSEKVKELDEVLPNPPTLSPMTKTNFEVTQSPFVICHYQTCFKPHDVIKVWMTRSVREELIVPTIQMVEINPLVRICVQHNAHPAECFSDQNLCKASRKHYSSITEYVHTWEKVLLAEAAEKSVKECRQVIIHDVKLDWPQLVVPSNCIDEEYYEPMGSISLTLPKKYVENCSEFIQFNEGDLVCVRYGIDGHMSTRAVFHMIIHKINYNRDDETTPTKVMMKMIGDKNRRISEKMKSILGSMCELQLISLSTSYQRVYQGLQKLLDVSNENKSQKPSSRNRSSKKARDIGKLVEFVALGKEINLNVSNESRITRTVFREYPQSRQLWGIPPGQTVGLNRVQEDAANLAFTKPFQLIQGPPGTGKSETGAHIAFTFAMANRQLGSPQKCVLYCGPSNKSVDVVLEKLNKLCNQPNMDLKILRIYGRAVENRDFPGPDSKGKVDQSAKSEYTCPKWAQKYALHHRIREGHHATNLRELEDELGSLPEGSVADGQMRKKYRRALLDAEEAALAQQEFDIVLCTCNEASSKRVLKCVYPRQCIVDECGMAYEPECIAPLELCDHAVLLGDHKQLQPVIDYQPARENGLSTSLFQRYADNFEAQYTKTLTIQYRMHEAICEFPSKQFYKGELKTDDSVKKRKNSETKLDEFWPGPRKSRCPILFCNVVGKEGDYETGGKAVGGKKIGISSKFNQKEAQKVVQIAKVLNIRHKVNTSHIAVLTPYSAQKNLIEDKIKEANLKIKVASITESQGDEYGIVILSTVRSLPIKEIANPKHVQADRGWLLEKLGFLTDEHQLNVGITRSKYGLIIIGNKKLLTYDKTWKALIEHYEEKGCTVEGDRFCTS